MAVAWRGAELEAVLVTPDGAEPGPDEALAKKVLALKRQWDQAPAVTRAQAEPLVERFTKAMNAVIDARPAAFKGTDLDPEATRKRMEQLCHIVEGFAGEEKAEAQMSPAAILAAQLREALAANTIGGRADDEARWRNAADEVRKAQASWRRLGPVPDAVSRELDARFQKACNRFFRQLDHQNKISSTQRPVEKSVDIVHRFARDLRPTVLDDLGLIPALHSFMKSFTSRTGVRTSLTAFAAVEQLDAAKRTVLFRVAQEALTNVARHAQANRVEVSTRKIHGRVCMSIKDDGKSFNVERMLHSQGNGRLGLLGMRERLEMVGGNLVVESSPHKGTTVQAQIPLGKAPARAPARGAEKLADELRSFMGTRP